MKTVTCFVALNRLATTYRKVRLHSSDLRAPRIWALLIGARHS